MKKIFLLLVFSIALFSCNDDNGDSENNEAFDRGALLSEWANDFIIPDFETAAAANAKLVTAKNEFIENASELNLVNLRTSYLDAYKAFQLVEKYNIGKAEELNFILNLNAFPTDVVKIQSNVENQATVNLSSVLNQNAQGFPALDYLINGLGTTNTEIVAFYTGTEKDNYLSYLSKLVDRINSLNNQILTDWKGNGKRSFTGNSSSSVNGSVNIFVDKYINYFERRLRSAKVGVPLGHFTTEPFPQNIESLFKPEESRLLLKEAFNGARELYFGKNGNSSLSQTIKNLGNTELDMKLRQLFEAAESTIGELDSNLKLQVETDITKMRETRDALQRIVVLLKVDAASTLSISILSPDSDGD